MKIKPILMGLIIGVLLIAGIQVFQVNNPLNSASIETSSQNSKESISTMSVIKSTGSTSMGDVEIELKPHEITNGQLKVDISANTHSVELDQFDLKEIVTLEYGGELIKPISAPTLSGHHVSGTLVFDVEFEFDGKRDILNNTVDAIGSVANFINKKGKVEPNTKIVLKATHSGDRPELKSSFKPYFKVSDLKSFGITPVEKLQNQLE